MTSKVNTAAIPRELTGRPQWVTWRREVRNGEPTKVPYSPKTGRKAKSDDPATWATFSAAVATMDHDAHDGVGYELSAADPYTGFDFDNCIDDDGQVEPWAAYHVEGLDSYTEVSPSGRGLRIIVKGKLPPGRRKLVIDDKRRIEVYDRGRFLTLTGHRWPGTPANIADRSAILDFWHADTFGEPPAPLPQLAIVPVNLEDQDILAKACSARSAGPDFEALYYRGDVGLYGGDDSRADYHLCRLLLFWTGGDDSRADRLFRSSALMRPKWDEKRGETTYGGLTMAAASANLRAVYNPTTQPSTNGNGIHNGNGNGHAPPGRVQAGVQAVQLDSAETSHRFRPIPADELDTRPRRPWLIKGEIAAGQFTLLFGPSEGGKSFIALDWALQLAQTQPVIYVAGEDADGYAARKIAWCKHHNKGAGQLYFVETPVNLFDARQVDEFIEWNAPLQPVLIVFDTLARCMVGADENSARDVGIVIDNLEYIRRTIGCAVLPVHHTGKNGNTYRGSSTLMSHAYGLIELSADDDLITIICRKAKNSAKFPARKVRLVQVQTGRPGEDGEAETSLVPLPANEVYTHGPDLTSTQRLTLETLAMPTFANVGAKADTLRELLNVPRSTIYSTLSALMRKGFVRQASKGDPYYITTMGESAAGLLEVQSSPNDVQLDSVGLP